MATRKNVPAAEVIAWARALADAGTPLLSEDGSLMHIPARGRLSAVMVKAFHRANKSKRYAPGVAQGRTVSGQVPTTDSLGRPRTANVTLPVAQVRSQAIALGFELGKRGRIPAEAFQAVALASLSTPAPVEPAESELVSA